MSAHSKNLLLGTGLALSLATVVMVSGCSSATRSALSSSPPPETNAIHALRTLKGGEQVDTSNLLASRSELLTWTRSITFSLNNGTLSREDFANQLFSRMNDLRNLPQDDLATLYVILGPQLYTEFVMPEVNFLHRPDYSVPSVIRSGIPTRPPSLRESQKQPG